VAVACDLIVKGAILRAVRGILRLRYYCVNVIGIYFPPIEGPGRQQRLLALLVR
jgi:hypothetical protein